MRNDAAYLEHIRDSLDLIREWLADPSGAPDRRLFYEDRRTQAAVLRHLETLTDAARHLSDSLKSRYPSLPWPRIAGFRNVLAHVYLELDFDAVWDVIANDLPELRALIDPSSAHSPSGLALPPLPLRRPLLHERPRPLFRILRRLQERRHVPLYP